MGHRLSSAIAVTAALLSGPGQAAEMQAGLSEVRAGAFIGARLRLPLGADGQAKPQAALMLASTRSYRSAAGRTVTRFGDGVAVDLIGRGPTLTLGGTRADVAMGLRQQGNVGSRHKLGLSTGGWIAIGAVVAVAAIVVVGQLTCIGEDEDHCGSD